MVYGDIGTSPLYALRECFYGPHAFEATPENVLGILSLVVWSLLLVVSLKYLVVVLRAHHDGEGGILALMTLVLPATARRPAYIKRAVVVLGLFGATLLYGDGVITPAISVLSAVEGLRVATPFFDPYVIPLTVLILAGLFFLQSRGTGRIGFLFGPVILIWFLVLGALGLIHTVKYPAVLQAINPWHGAAFFLRHGLAGIVVLGAVFLVVTGGEALYADLGHFGRRPIQLSWFAVALPGLLLNYFGQGALLLRQPAQAGEVFFRMAPAWGLYPLVVLATAATIIASQAVISGAFSLTMQAMRLGFLPRMEVQHTSQQKRGQIYMPAVNWLLFLGTVGVVVEFQGSSELAAAYGVAVSTTMVITTFLLACVVLWIWKWPLWPALGALLFFCFLDLAFFSAMLTKIGHGGWFPLAVAAGVYLLMGTWNRGRAILQRRMRERIMPLEEFLLGLEKDPPNRPDGTAVYMVGDAKATPRTLIWNYRHNKVVHRQVIFLTIEQLGIPFVSEEKRFQVENLPQGFHRVVAAFGFMEKPDMNEIMRRLDEEDNGIRLDPQAVTYVLGRETLLPMDGREMARWRKHLFAFLSRNAQKATKFFNLPAEQVLEIGALVEL